MKKVLVLSGSPRERGNSDLLCDQFMKGALEKGNLVEKININQKSIGYCQACYYCRKNNGKCIIADDMEEIIKKMVEADVIVFASPVYFYSIAAQLKALIDRTVARWLDIHDKDFYYIMTCADKETVSATTTLECFRGYAACVKGAKEKGVIYGTGVYEKGTIKDTQAYSDAYLMGASV